MQKINLEDQPEAFLCPITQVIMIDPVMDAVGNTYERRDMEMWLINHNTDPMTNEELPNKNLIPNKIIKTSIIEYKEGTFQHQFVKRLQKEIVDLKNTNINLRGKVNDLGNEKKELERNRSVEKKKIQEERKELERNMSVEKKEIQEERLSKLVQYVASQLKKMPWISDPWSHDGGINIHCHLGKVMMRIAWVGGLVNDRQEERPARTGEFRGQSFTAQVRLVEQYKGNKWDCKTSWRGIQLALVDSEIPVKKEFYNKTLYKLHNKEDPASHIYGIDPHGGHTFNVKRKTHTSQLHKKDPIEVIYNRDEATVRFVSKTFEYQQTRLPKDKNFTLVIGMCLPNQVVEVQAVNIQ